MAPRKSELTSAAPYYTMNMVNSTLFSVLSGIYTVVALLYCLVMGAPKENKLTPVEFSAAKDRRRTAIITGANTGIGFASAQQLVLDHNVDVILACRSRDKAVKAAEKINEEAKSAGVSARALFLHPCDLSSFDSIRQFSQKFLEKYEILDILICNAGVNNTTEGRTADDLDIIFQSNTLGHFLLTQLLFELFPESGEGRIVTLSSVAHHFVDSSAPLDDKYWQGLAKNDSASKSFLPAYLRTVFEDCMQSYPPSKLATLLFAMELNRRFNSPNDKNKKKRVRAFAVNPGAVASDIWRSFPAIANIFMKLIFLTTEQGCATTIAAAVGKHDDESVVYLQPYWMPDSASKTAPFPALELMGPFVGYNVTQPRLPMDGGIFASTSLWKACEELTGCKFE